MEQIETQQVSREAVFKVASLILQTSIATPTVASIKSHFETPTSPSIAVYFREWKEIHKEQIEALFPSPARLRQRCNRQQQEISELAARLEAQIELSRDFTQFIRENHPHVLTEWNNYEVEELSCLD